MTDPKLQSLRELVTVQQQRWADGDRVTVEDLVAEHSHLPSDPAALMDLIYTEVLLREASGEAPNVDEYCGRFPDLTESIQRQFQVHRVLNPPAAGSTDVGMGDTAGGPRDPASDFPRIPGFECVRRIGRGSTGVVFEAIDQKLNRTVAIKLLASGAVTGEKQRLTLQREAEAIASVEHPGIVRVHQTGKVAGCPFIVMEFVDGGSLAQLLRQGPLPVDSAVDLATSVARAIQHAHGQELLHRDIKPGNILLDHDNNPRVCDFGLATRLDSDQTLHATGDILGTPAYMPPEQARGEATDKRADVYAVGAVLYEMLSGRSPFQAATTWDILNQVMTTDPVPVRQLNSAIPRDLETICGKCLEKNRDRRYGSVAQVADELDRFRKGEPIQARPVSALERFGKWCRRNRRVAVLTMTSLTLVLSLGVVSTVAAFSLSAANASITKEQQNASAAEQAAVRDRTAAIAALNHLVDSLYEDLSRNAATIKTRRKVLDAAISGLQSITQVAGTDEADATTVKAYQRIGELLSLQDRNPEAVEYYTRAIDLCRSALTEKPDEPEATRTLAISLSILGTHYSRLADHEKAGELIAESNALLRKVLSAAPQDVTALRQVVTNHQQTLDSQWTDRAAHLAHGEEALNDARELVDLAPADSQALGIVQGIYFRVGRAHLEQGDNRTAGDYFDKARGYVDQALQHEPNNVRFLSASAVITRAHAMVHQARGHLDESSKMFASALVEFRDMSAADPGNTQLQQQIANTYSLHATVLYAAGEFAESAAATRQAADIYLDILSNAPDNASTRVLVAEARFNEANAHLGLNDWNAAADSYEQVLHYLTAPEFGQPLTSGVAGQYVVLSQFLHEGVARLTRRSTSKQTPTGECVALMLAARDAAFRSTDAALPEQSMRLLETAVGGPTVSTFDELYQRMHKLEGLHPFIGAQRSFWEARTYAIQARQLAASGVNTEQADEKTAIALQHLTDTFEQIPGLLPTILNEPDLTWLVETTGFPDKRAAATPTPER